MFPAIIGSMPTAMEVRESERENECVWEREGGRVCKESVWWKEASIVSESVVYLFT